MKKLILPLMLVSPTLLAQTFTKDVADINKKLGEQIIDTHVKSGGKEPMNGAALAAIMPEVKLDETQTCVEEEPETKGVHYEVIFVAQGNTQQTSLTKDAYSPGYTHTVFARELVKYAADSKLSEAETVTAMSNMIKTKFASDQDRYDALSALAARLYTNYNDSRNPGQISSKNDPIGKLLPGGDMSVNQLARAAADFSVYDGGVCNDISEAIAMIGEKVFPDKDVLIINQGTHHGVVISDGKTNRIIDSYKQLTMENRLLLNENLTATNMRVNKMYGGIMKEIAVVDTQTGQLMEQAFQTGKPLLKTDIDISSLVTHFKVVKTKDEGKSHELDVATGMGDLAQSKMFVVVAKYEYNSERWRNYVGFGGSAVNFDSNGATKYQLHFRAGSEFGIIRYATPKLQLNLTQGLYAEGFYGFKNPNALSPLDAAGGVELGTKAGIAYRPVPKLKLSADLQARIAFGPNNWGAATGAWSGGTGEGLAGVITNMGLHLNVIDAKVGIDYKASEKVTAFAQGKYQGSNIGQVLDIMGGIAIKAPADAEIIVFSGYSTTKLPGYITQHSLLAGNNGAYIGAGYQSKSGITFTGAVSNITTEAPPTINLNLSVPLGAPPKKYTSHHIE